MLAPAIPLLDEPLGAIDLKLRTLPIVVYGMVRRNVEPSINAISTIILLVTTALIYLADRMVREK